MTTNSIGNVSAVEANGVGVYWDSGCSNGVSLIDWGNLAPGSLKSIVVYIRNEAEESKYLILRTTNWKPLETFQYLNLKWDYDGQRIKTSENLQITLTLSVSRYIEGISSFSFDIIVTGSESLPGDINGDGHVNIWDLGLISEAWFTESGDPDYDPRADLNADDKVNIWDKAILSENWLLG